MFILLCLIVGCRYVVACVRRSVVAWSWFIFYCYICPMRPVNSNLNTLAFVAFAETFNAVYMGQWQSAVFNTRLTIAIGNSVADCFTNELKLFGMLNK